MTATTRARLDRRSAGLPAPGPVRIAHLGLGSFFRSHQAWYTHHAPDAAGWGIAAFSNSSTAVVDALTAQDGAYTLVTKDPEGDRHEAVGSVAAAFPGADLAAWRSVLADPEVAVVTLTVTEAGYCRGGDGGLDTGRADVAEDLEALRRDPEAQVRTAPARLVAGLLARRAVGAGPLSIVPCDNLPRNGQVAHDVVRQAAAAVDPGLAGWVDDQVSFVSTVVDRITPRTTDADRDAAARATGLVDASPVVTEPFTEWILSGEFPAGRPAWEEAGARFTDDVEVFEHRKLWLLNGSHSLLAYAGGLRGHRTVSEAVADPTCRGWVEQWWDEATGHLPLPAGETAAYRQSLLDRFANPRIEHQLAQIAADGSQKLPVRLGPVLRAERAAGILPEGGLRVVAAWLLHLRGRSTPVVDPAAASLADVAGLPDRQAARRVLEVVSSDLAEDDAAVTAVADLAGALGG